MKIFLGKLFIFFFAFWTAGTESSLDCGLLWKSIKLFLRKKLYTRICTLNIIPEILYWSWKCMNPSWEVPNFDFWGKSFLFFSLNFLILPCFLWQSLVKSLKWPIISPPYIYVFAHVCMHTHTRVGGGWHWYIRKRLPGYLEGVGYSLLWDFLKCIFSWTLSMCWSEYIINSGAVKKKNQIPSNKQRDWAFSKQGFW